MTCRRSADDLHEPADRFVKIGTLAKFPKDARWVPVEHPRIAVAEQVQRPVAEYPNALAQLGHPHLEQVGARLGCVDRFVQDVARLAAGAGDKDGVQPLR